MFFFFFNDTATTEIYTLSLHDALPISVSLIRTIELVLGLSPLSQYDAAARPMFASFTDKADLTPYDHLDARIEMVIGGRSEEHTSELQSHSDLVCRLLLAKKNRTSMTR